MLLVSTGRVAVGRLAISQPSSRMTEMVGIRPEIHRRPETVQTFVRDGNAGNATKRPVAVDPPCDDEGWPAGALVIEQSGKGQLLTFLEAHIIGALAMIGFRCGFGTGKPHLAVGVDQRIFEAHGKVADGARQVRDQRRLGIDRPVTELRLDAPKCLIACLDHPFEMRGDDMRRGEGAALALFQGIAIIFQDDEAGDRQNGEQKRAGQPDRQSRPRSIRAWQAHLHVLTHALTPISGTLVAV